MDRCMHRWKGKGVCVCVCVCVLSKKNRQTDKQTNEQMDKKRNTHTAAQTREVYWSIGNDGGCVRNSLDGSVTEQSSIVLKGNGNRLRIGELHKSKPIGNNSIT